MFWRQVRSLVTGTAIGQLASVAALPLVTRLYTPEEFGIFGVVLAFVTMWSTIQTLRYESAIFVADSRSEMFGICLLCLAVVFGTSMAAMPVLAMLVKFDVGRLGYLGSESLVACFPLLLGFGIFRTYRVLALRSAAIKVIRNATIARSILSGVLKVGLGALGVGAFGLITAEMLAAWVGLAMLRAPSLKEMSKQRGDQSLREIARKYSRFPRLEAPSTLVDTFSAFLVFPLVAQIFGLEVAAYFMLAQRVVALPNSHIGGAVADIVQKSVAEKVRTGDLHGISSTLRSLAKMLFKAGVGPYLAIMVLSPFVFGVVFGSKWESSGTVAAILAPALFAALLVSPVSRVLLVIQRQDLKLYYDFFNLGWTMAAFGLAWAGSWNVYATLMLYSAGRCGGYYLYWLLIDRATRDYARKGMTA